MTKHKIIDGHITKGQVRYEVGDSVELTKDEVRHMTHRGVIAPPKKKGK